MCPSAVPVQTFTLEELRVRIGGEIGAHPHLAAIRDYNRFAIGELNKVYPLAGKSLLDLGASIHGYALEAALDLGATRYVGIDFDVSRHWGAAEVEINGAASSGHLRQMNAEALDFPEATFDCLSTISTFEHFLQPAVVLREMHRVLRPGGAALVNFEPIWSSPKGHHLHHFGAVSDLAPLWSHLYLSEDQMRAVLARQPWPENAPVDLEGALRWIYHDRDINRFGLRELLGFFEQSAFTIEWICPLRDETPPEVDAVAAYLSRVLPYTAEELLTRGLSLLLSKR